MTVALAARRRTRFQAVLAAATCALVAAAAGTATVLLTAISTGQGAARQTQCANNLKNLMSVVQERRASKSWRGGRPRGDLLESARLRPGLEWDLFFACPRDEETRARIEERALAEESGPVPSSYLVRDFERCPLPSGTAEKFPLLLCMHHEGGVNVGYDDSSVVFLDREALGLAPEDAIATGPESKSELLRVFPPRAR